MDMRGVECRSCSQRMFAVASPPSSASGCGDTVRLKVAQLFHGGQKRPVVGPSRVEVMDTTKRMKRSTQRLNTIHFVRRHPVGVEAIAESLFDVFHQEDPVA